MTDTLIVSDAVQDSQLEDPTRVKTADSTLGSLEETASANKAVLAKDEEEFLKLESIFITELGLSKENLPVFLK